MRTAKQVADQRLAPLLEIAEGTGKGPGRNDVKFEDAAAEFGLTSDDRKRALPASLKPVITGTPKGTFSGRTAAESRAFALDKKLPRGTTLYAAKVGDHWCVIRACNGLHEILEG